MKIGLFGSPNTQETKWLIEEGKKRKHEMISFSIFDIAFRVHNNEFQLMSKHNFSTFDIFFVRGLFKPYLVDNIHFDKSTEGLLFLRYANEVLKKPIVDERLATGPTIISKMSTSLTLSKVNLPLPETMQFTRKSHILNNIETFSFPIIIKNPAGRKGKNIYKIDSKDELMKFLKKMPKQLPFLFQEYLPTDGDIRILVIGYKKVIGAMKRHLVPGDFRANISQGAKAEKYPLNKEIIEYATKAAEATKTEFAGVDIIESKGKYYVIEVNRTPQFKGFRKYTGINPAPFILDYLEEKVERNK